VSITIRYDSFTVRHLAYELLHMLARQHVEAVRFRYDTTTVALLFEERLLEWDLRSGRVGWSAATERTVAGEAPLILPRHAVVSDVLALADERVLRLELHGRARPNAAHAIVFELLSTQRNAIALDAQNRVLKQLGSRGSKRQHRGRSYQAPVTNERRPVNLQEWLALLEPLPEDARRAALVEHVAYTSPLNAAAILSAADLSQAHARFIELVTSAAAPAIVLINGEQQPYPHSLWQSDAIAKESLIDAIQSVLDEPVSSKAILAQLTHAVERAQKKVERLTAELGTASQDATRLRADADLLLANVREAKRGSKVVDLIGFDGQPVRLQLDPALSATEQAQSWYTQARKRERAADQLPALIAQAEAELLASREQVERVRSGEAVEIELPRSRAKQRPAPTEKLPYRRYRTASGLEVRVGRSSRGNDELTLHHSSGNDVWMHARDVGGAHVVLRWSDADNTPPKQDLVQAATLAALHSKARHSRVVPVDWTRRKHVRKRRGSPPGQVMVDRAKTIFVEPVSGIEEQLRWTDESR
jgi:predicted ribosome quality control (RQC) complex YloA/Tae2 family protein